jgi:hypothetical protein
LPSGSYFPQNRFCNTTPLVAIFAGAAGRTRTFAALGLLILAAAEYKAFGTSRWFNAARGAMPVAATSGPRSVAGMNSDNYESLRRRPDSRVALDITGLVPSALRHAGLTTPQGFDPLLPAQYHSLIDLIWPFRTNREFDVTPENEQALRLLGVGAFVTAESAPLYARLVANPHFRLLRPGDSYYKVFEFLGAQPAFGWEQSGTDRTAVVAAWMPERRSFRVRCRRRLPSYRTVLSGMERYDRRRSNRNRALSRSIPMCYLAGRRTLGRVPVCLAYTDHRFGDQFANGLSDRGYRQEAIGKWRSSRSARLHAVNAAPAIRNGAVTTWSGF